MTNLATIPSALQTVPGAVPLAVTEKYAIGNDVTSQLSGTDTVSAAVVTLYDLETSTSVGSLPAPSVVGNVITQVIDAAALALVAGNYYRITWTFTANANKRPSSQTILVVCPAP